MALESVRMLSAIAERAATRGLPCLSRQGQWLQSSVSLEWQGPMSPIQEMQIVTNARVRMIRGAVVFQAASSSLLTVIGERPTSPQHNTAM